MDRRMDLRREHYLRKQQTELGKLDASIRYLEVKAMSAKTEVRQSVGDAIDEARRKRAEINERLKALAQTGSNAWKDIKRVVDSTKMDIKRIVRRSISEIEKS